MSSALFMRQKVSRINRPLDKRRGGSEPGPGIDNSALAVVAETRRMPIDLNQASRVTSRSSWTATAAGRRSTACRASRATARARKAVREVVRAAREIGLRALTLYAFSAQNWQRPPDEVATLMQLLRDYVIEERDEIMDNDIRLIAIGDVERLPAFVRDPLDALIARLGRQPVDDAVPGAVLRRARVDRRRGARAVRGGRRGDAAARRDHRGAVRGRAADRRAAAAGPAGPHLGRGAAVELPALGGGLRRAVLHRHVLARLRQDGACTQALESYRGRERRFGRTREQIRSAG